MIGSCQYQYIFGKYHGSSYKNIISILKNYHRQLVFIQELQQKLEQAHQEQTVFKPLFRCSKLEIEQAQQDFAASQSWEQKYSRISLSDP